MVFEIALRRSAIESLTRLTEARTSSSSTQSPSRSASPPAPHMGRDDINRAPSYGYCASQGKYYYGYKLHGLTGVSGVFHSYDITAANVHDINYLNDVGLEYHDCGIIGDKGYISVEVQLDLFEMANILFYNISTKSTTNLLVILNMRYFNSANG